MHEIIFIQDLAIIMSVAGITTILFHRFKQPVVLGYILAGIIIGPHTPPFALVHDKQSIYIFSELGVIFLMFSLGLEFSLRKLTKVGLTSLITALLEIIVMIWVGYKIGQAFSWKTIDSIFLGGMLAISSTTIIVKAISELKLQKETFVQLIYGILIVEDILAIAIIALLSGIGTTHTFNVTSILTTLGKLLIFLTVTLSIGFLLIPRLMNAIAKLKNTEILVVTTLAMCFGFCLLVIKLEYSVVLGAFLIGAIMAESQYLHQIEKVIEPIREMFSAVFFVAVGLMFEPKVLMTHGFSIFIITIAVIVSKILTCSFGAYITGNDGKTSLKIGMGLAQIGEFSFVIAALGSSIKVTSDFLYPIAVAVSAITTITTPYFIRGSQPLASIISNLLPKRLIHISKLYTVWIQNISTKNSPSEITRLLKKSLVNIFINLTVVAAIFIGASHIANIPIVYQSTLIKLRFFNTLLWGFSLLISMPFLIAIYRKLQALSMLLAELSVKPHIAGRLTQSVRALIAGIIPILCMVIILLFIFALSANILPSKELFVILIAVLFTIIAILWKWFIKLHAKLQIALIESFKKEN